VLGRGTISAWAAFCRLGFVGVGVASSFRGVYIRVARKLKVSPSMVSRVADGHRISPKIQAALREELHAIKQKLDSIF
jgi:hypothetical protein